MSAPMPVTAPGDYRFFCGRRGRTPLWVRLINQLGWHQYMKDVPTRVRKKVVRKGGKLYLARIVYHRHLEPAWVLDATRGSTVYTCRRPRTHWRATVKPQGERRMVRVDVTNRIKPGHRPLFKYAEGVEVAVPTESWEVGHRYEFTRWEKSQ